MLARKKEMLYNVLNHKNDLIGGKYGKSKI